MTNEYDQWRPYTLLDGDGCDFLIGDYWQVLELYEALRALVNDGKIGPDVTEEELRLPDWTKPKD
jgi:hypothetical protein